MKIVLLSLVLISSMFAANATVTAHINGETKVSEMISQKAYYFRCIDGYKWIQFARVNKQGDINTAAELIEEGLPIQMYKDAFPNARISIPVVCN